MIKVNMDYPTIKADVNIPKTVATGDMTNYYTKDEVNQLVENVEVDLTGYATENYVDQKINDIPEVDLTGYATENYVNQQIANIDFPETDLSNYYTKPEVDVLVENADKIYVGDTEPTDDSLIWISQNGLNEPVATENYVSETISSALGAIGVAEQEAF